MSPERLTDYLMRFEDYNDLPDDLDIENEPSVTYEIGQTATPPPRSDLVAYECYLREKWHCSDTIPGEFDPDELERKRQALLKSSLLPSPAGQETDALGDSTNDEPQPESSSNMDEDDYEPTTAVNPSGWLTVPFPTYENSSAESIVSITESLDTEGFYDDDVTVGEAQEQRMSRVFMRPRANAVSSSAPTSPVESLPPPPLPAKSAERQPSNRRIRRGSRPPLSKSAFSNVNCCGAQCTDANCRMGVRRSSVAASPKAPRYFPFRSRMLAGPR